VHPERQGDPEDRPAADAARGAEGAAHQADELAAEGQAQARAAVAAGRRPLVGLDEGLEDPLDLLLQDPDPGVLDGDPNVASPPRLRRPPRSGTR
jgi:hypothetical protein